MLLNLIRLIRVLVQFAWLLLDSAAILLVVTTVVGVDAGIMTNAADGVMADSRDVADGNGGCVLHDGVGDNGHLHVDGVGTVDGHLVGHLLDLLNVDRVGLLNGHGVGLGHLNGHWTVDGHMDGHLLVTDDLVGLRHWDGHLHVFLDWDGNLADDLVGLWHGHLNLNGHTLLMHNRVGAVHMHGHWDTLGDGDGLVHISLLADHIGSGYGMRLDGNGGSTVSDGDGGSTVSHSDGGSRVSVAAQTVAMSGQGAVANVANIETSMAVAIAQIEQTALVQLLLQRYLLFSSIASIGGGHQEGS